MAEQILISKAALEGEHKQVTMLFADLKASLTSLCTSCMDSLDERGITRERLRRWSPRCVRCSLTITSLVSTRNLRDFYLDILTGRCLL